jgi:ethanolamine utilization protein EutN
MRLCKVVGKVWAGQKVRSLEGCRFCIVQPVDDDGSAGGLTLVAADPQNIACSGDTVVVVTSTDAVQAFDAADAPVNASIVALVDSLD